MVRIITDCTGDKLLAIEGVFRGRFGLISSQQVTKLSLPTPLSIEAVFETTGKRLDNLVKQTTPLPESPFYYVTIQRFFFFDGKLWNLCADTAIRSSSGQIMRGFTSSVPLDEETSNDKSADKTRNISTLLAEKHPHWHKQTSVYKLLTGKEELDLFQIPLRDCLKQMN